MTPPATPRARLPFKLLTVVFLTLAIALVGWQLWRAEQRFGSVVVPAGESSERAWRVDGYVVDELVGHRPARNATVRSETGGLGSTAATTVRHSNNHGFVSAEDLPEEIPSPRVLMLGDGQLAGVVDTADNAGTLLRDALRAGPTYPRAVVLNAACPFYGLYQYVLRARQLLPRYRPQVLIVTVFTGNDLLELEDRTRPHLNDSLIERPPDPTAPPGAAAERRDRLALPESLAGAFSQGLDQAAFLALQPTGRATLLDKAQHALTLLEAAADEHGARLLIALLPPFDLVFPDRAGATEYAREVLDVGAQRRIHDEVRELLTRRRIAVIDLLPRFRAIGELDLYAVDFHIWKRGHRALAEQLARPVRRMLDGLR